LGLDESGGTVDTHDQTPSDLRVKGTRVTSLLHAEDALQPSDDFVRGRVRGLVEVDDAGFDVGLQVPLQRGHALDRVSKEIEVFAACSRADMRERGSDVR
jgi:hypothetical protein